MRRLIAILLGVALASAAGQASALHTHAYTDHDHPEHHHGLAAHEHHAVETHPAHDAASLEPCDPGHHAVSLILGCAALTHLHTLSAECGTTASIEPLVPLHSVTMLRDVRVHGPPPHAQAAPRAPPLTSRA